MNKYRIGAIWLCLIALTVAVTLGAVAINDVSEIQERIIINGCK